MIVFFVPVDIPFEALLLSAESVATFVEVDVEVLLDTSVVETRLPSLVITLTVVVTCTLVASLREVDRVTLSLDEELLESLVVVAVEESDVGVTEVLVCVGVELGGLVETGVDEGVEEGVFDEESLVGVADVLAGEVVLGAAELSADVKPLKPEDKSEITPDNSSCLLFWLGLKRFVSTQSACVRAKKTARTEAWRTWDRENIMTVVCVLNEMRKEYGRKDDEEMGIVFAPSYSRYEVCQADNEFAET
jgi:hypothetical protein